MFDWQGLLVALGLFLVFEGILPFISPEGYRKAAQKLSEMPDQVIRITGGLLMLAGVAALYLVH